MNAENLTMLVSGLIGGLGLFLLGMKNMSEGMQAVAGAGLRRMIAAVTNNRFLAIGVGTAVTCVVQSSSITTVMVVGLVNSAVMELSQAIGVIMGANIGTTITGWILVLKVDRYGLPLLGLAAFLYLFSKGEKKRYWAMSAMGLGMVFFGLVLMKDACAVIKSMPEFNNWFQTFEADSYLGVLQCACVGCVVTMAVQSSSATLGITISLAVQGVISFESAGALVLGENIGTTITAYLASLGATTNARRAAYFHVMFNMIGVFWITLIFGWYMTFIRWLVPAEDVTARIAATHSMFNVANTLLFLPFVPLFPRLLERIAPGKPFKEKPHLTDLDIRMLSTPLLAIEQSRKEILKMADSSEKMLDWLQTLTEQDPPDEQLAERLREREGILDNIQDEITHFVTNLLSGSAPHAAAEEGRRQIRMAHEYESIGDYVDNIWKFDRKLRRSGLRFPDKQRAVIRELHALVAEFVRGTNAANREQDGAAISRLDALSKQIRRTIKECRRGHLDDLSTEAINPQVSVAFMATLNAYARVRDHARNIGEVIAGEK
jgi:phosphate:Na+ symporter